MKGEEFWTARARHTPEGLELHFHVSGKFDGRDFVVNVALPAAHEETGEWLRPSEYEFAVAKILQFILGKTVPARKALH